MFRFPQPRSETVAAWAIPALVFATMAAAMAAEPRAPVADPAENLVLALNLISGTHARPATGVVLAPAESDRPALVLVPASFVAAGDEIVVLDGGTDILRNGLATRTVARSAEIGVAVLEVAGLERAGAGLTADAWPPAPAQGLQFMAWPAAGALADGEPLTRFHVRLRREAGGEVEGTEPALPDVGGPLFDGCGRIAAWHIPSSEHRMAGSSELRDFMHDAGLDVAEAPCEASGSIPTAAMVDAAELPSANASATAEDADPEIGTVAETGRGEGVARHSPGLPRGIAAAIVAVAVALAAAGLYLRRRRRKAAAGPMLIGRDARGGHVRLALTGGADGEVTRLERAGVSVEFRAVGGRFLVSDVGDESGPLALAVAGVPCLPGERVIVGEGDGIRLADERFEVRVDE